MAEDYDLPDKTRRGIRDAIAPDEYQVEIFARFAFERITEEADDVIWGHENKNQINVAIQRVRDSRLLAVKKMRPPAEQTMI